MCNICKCRMLTRAHGYRGDILPRPRITNPDLFGHLSAFGSHPLHRVVEVLYHSFSLIDYC